MTLTAAANYTLTGVSANFFTVSGATATNSANSGVVTAVFPATTATLPSGYITSARVSGSGVLTWAPITTYGYWPNAADICSAMSNSVYSSGWRQPTRAELTALYNAYPNNSSILSGLGWSLGWTWSSEISSGDYRYHVGLHSGETGTAFQASNLYVSCVHQ